MFLNIVDKCKIGNNLSITLSGTHEKLKIGSIVKDDNDHTFTILSVAMVCKKNTSLKDETTILIKGTPEIGSKICI